MTFSVHFLFAYSNDIPHKSVEGIFFSYAVYSKFQIYLTVVLLTHVMHRLLTISDPYLKVAISLDMLFPRAWLTEKALDDAEGRSNMEVQTKVSL
jgi:hypothetical protein